MFWVYFSGDWENIWPLNKNDFPRVEVTVDFRSRRSTLARHQIVSPWTQWCVEDKWTGKRLGRMVWMHYLSMYVYLFVSVCILYVYVYIYICVCLCLCKCNIHTSYAGYVFAYPNKHVMYIHICMYIYIQLYNVALNTCAWYMNIVYRCRCTNFDGCVCVLI